MKYIKAIIFLISISILLQGCTKNQAQVKMIDAGIKPTIAIFSDVPDKVNFTIVGFTMFGNSFHSSQTNQDFALKIEQYGIKKLIADTKVNIYNLTDSDRNRLKAIKPGQDGRNSKEYISAFSKWANDKNIDFVAIVSSTSSQHIQYGRAGTPLGLGILDDSVSGTYLHSVLKIQLVDPKISEITDYTFASSFQKIPTIKNNTSSRFSDNDYKTIDNNKLNIISSKLEPLMKSNIEFILKDIGLTRERPGHTWIDKLPASSDNLF